MSNKRIRLSPEKCNFLGLPYKGRDKDGRHCRVSLSKDQVETLNSSYGNNVSESTNISHSGSGISLEYKGGRNINTKEKAIEFFEIDTSLYDVDDFTYKNWTTTMKVKSDQGETPVQVLNYAVNLKAYKKATEIDLSNFVIKPRKISRKRGNGSVVIPLSDFHIGASVTDLIKTKDFTLDIVCGYLNSIAEDINSDKFDKVHLMLLGDFIESFTGLNHINSWKGLSKNSYGMKAVQLAHEVLSEHLYSKINNLVSVDFCSGNHDRVTSNKGEDQSGEVAQMLHYLFNLCYKGIETQYSDLIVSRVVDRIGFLASHGHLGLSKKDSGKIVQDYGFSKDEVNFHFVLQGHYHSREKTSYFKKMIAKYEEVKCVVHDSLDYRKLTLPALFTGNFFSESLGYSSTAGYTKIYRDSNGKIRHEDITI